VAAVWPNDCFSGHADATTTESIVWAVVELMTPGSAMRFLSRSRIDAEDDDEEWLVSM